jgi:hypothetical protein
MAYLTDLLLYAAVAFATTYAVPASMPLRIGASFLAVGCFLVLVQLVVVHQIRMLEPAFVFTVISGTLAGAGTAIFISRKRRRNPDARS